MRAVVGRTLRDRFATYLILGASLPLLIAVVMIVLPALHGSPSPQLSPHLAALPPPTQPPPQVPAYNNLPFTTPTPDQTPTPAATPQSTPAAPADPFVGLCQQTQASVSDPGLANGLCIDLTEADQDYTAGHRHAESEAVRAYAHGVHDATGKSIDQATASSLIAAAGALPGIQSPPGG